MKNIRTFLLVAVGLVGLAVSGPVALSDTTQNQQHSAERAQVMDKRAPRHLAHGPLIQPPPFPEDPLPSPFDLCMTSCKAKKNQTDAACTAWCKRHGSVATAQI
ncbi:hypothetical protein V8E36_008276 [Tilletia maclaganii]